jgi:hypothetical protein
LERVLQKDGGRGGHKVEEEDEFQDVVFEGLQFMPGR